MRGFFRKKKRKITSLDDFEDAVFSSWGVSYPSNAQRIRLRFGLWISVIAIIPKQVGGDATQLLQVFEEALLNESRQLTLTVEELVLIKVPTWLFELSSADLLDAVSRRSNTVVHLNTEIDGATAMLALAEVCGWRAQPWVNSRTGGPFGVVGAANLLMRGFAIGGEDKADVQYWPQRSNEVIDVFLAMT